MAFKPMTAEEIQNSWAVGTQVHVQESGPMTSRNPSQVFPFIISNRNRAGRMASIPVTAADELRRLTSKDGKGVYKTVVKWLKYPNIDDSTNSDTSNGWCDVEGEEVEYNAATYYLEERTVFTRTFDGNIAQCSPEERARRIADTQNTLIDGATMKLSLQVEKELFARISATNPNYRHIGNLPTLDGTPRYPGEDLPLFLTTESRINFAGDRKLARDRMLGGFADYVYFGDTRAMDYAEAKRLSTGGDNPYDYSKLQELGNSRMLFSDNMASLTGLDYPLLLLEPGTFQFVSHAEFDKEPESDGIIFKQSVTDPIYGLTWNYIVRTESCGNRRFKTHYTMEIDWTLISAPQCERGDKRRDGTNGAYLYNIICSDDTVCDLPPVKALYDSNPIAINSCDVPNDTMCGTDCNVALSGSVIGDDYVVTANYKPSLGATAVTYAWAVDGAPTGGNTPTLTLDNDLVFGGEEVTVTITDSLNCVAVNSFVIDKACPRPSYLLKIGAGAAAAVTNGQTITAGTIADGALITLTIENDAASNTDLVVTDGDITGDINTVVLPTFPETVAPNGETSIKGNASSTIGSYAAVFTIASNDCNDPAFTITVEYDIA